MRPHFVTPRFVTSHFLTRCAAGAALLASTCLSSALMAPAALAGTLRAPGGGTVRALVIGIDKYANLDKRASLAGVKADALDIHQALAAAGVKVREPLLDEKAVRSRVIAEMNGLVDESKPGDLVIITYSGHGMRVRPYPQWKGLDRLSFQSQIALSRFGHGLVEDGHEIIVNREMGAWYSRLDAKGVDVLAVMDTCHGGDMRNVMGSGSGTPGQEIKVRTYTGEVDDKSHDSFAGIPMSQQEARVDIKNLKHVTFFAGATERSTVPEMKGIDGAHPAAVRGALSYYVARSIEGAASRDGKVTREELLKYLSPHVYQATEGRQSIDFEPKIEGAEAVEKVVFLTEGVAAPEPPKPAPAPAPHGAALQGAEVQPPPQPQGEPVRVAVVNGPETAFSTIGKARAPFVQVAPAEADLIWDVGQSNALSRGDLVMTHVDGTVLGGVIDRTWAVREIRKLTAGARIIDARIGDNGKSYSVGQRPELAVDGVRDAWLTAVNIAADGTIQMLFPFYASDQPHVMDDQWIHPFDVQLPYGTDYTVVIATSSRAGDLLAWLHGHNLKPDAVELPAVIGRTIAADPKARAGAAGLYTAAP
jgi:hypothetical protein